MRIETELSIEDRNKVVKFSKEKGLRLRRAYTKLIKKALEDEGY